MPVMFLMFLFGINLLFLESVQAQMRCDMSDPFEKDDCLVMRYINDPRGWSSETERRLEVLLESRYVDVNRPSSFLCLDNWGGGKSRIYLGCAVSYNIRATRVLLKHGADPNGRNARNINVAYFLYNYPRLGRHGVTWDEYVDLEVMLLNAGMDPNQIGLFHTNPKFDSIPAHYSYLLSCARDDPHFDTIEAHWRNMVEIGVYDLNARTEKKRVARDLLQDMLDQQPRSGQSNTARCRRMLQFAQSH